jgi:CBS domain-containing protein
MVPLERLVRVGSDDELMSALRAMDDAGVVEVPVIDGSRFVGIISREQVLHYIRVRTELGV